MPECKNCKDEKETAVMFSQSAYELHEYRHERREKRLWILNIILVFLLVVTNVIWIWYESQFEVVESWEITQENENGYNNYIGNDGDIVYGQTDY